MIKYGLEPLFSTRKSEPERYLIFFRFSRSSCSLSRLIQTSLITYGETNGLFLSKQGLREMIWSPASKMLVECEMLEMKLESLTVIERAVSKKRSEREEFFRRTSLMKSCETSNEFIVATYLLEHGPATRGEIVKETPVKWTTAHDSLVRLQVKGIVKREVVPRGRGRPLVYWSLAD